MEERLVRDEIVSDHAGVRLIHEAAFGQPDEARIVEALRTSASPRVSLVAEVAEVAEGTRRGSLLGRLRSFGRP